MRLRKSPSGTGIFFPNLFKGGGDGGGGGEGGGGDEGGDIFKPLPRTGDRACVQRNTSIAQNSVRRRTIRNIVVSNMNFSVDFASFLKINLFFLRIRQLHTILPRTILPRNQNSFQHFSTFSTKNASFLLSFFLSFFLVTHREIRCIHHVTQSESQANFFLVFTESQTFNARDKYFELEKSFSSTL